MYHLTRLTWKLALAACALALPTLLFGSSSRAQGGENYGLKIYRVESGLYPYVQVYFRTFNREQEPLINLNYMNLGIMVKGRSYDPRKAQYGVQPIRQRPEAVGTVLVIDASKSMAGSPFEAALRAAARFIDSKRPQDQVAILATRDNDQGYEVVSSWERNADALGRRIADIRAVGMKTRLYDTIAAAMKMTALSGQGSQNPGAGDYVASHAIVVLSDGRDEGSALTRQDLNSRISSLDIPIPIYSVAYSKVSDEYFKNLEALSTNSFGVYYPLGGSLDRMQNTVEAIQSILLGDYVLTFRSYLPVDGESHAFKLGVEYPAGSGRFVYQSGRFEAIEPPPAKAILDQVAALSEAIQTLPDGNPFIDRGTPQVGTGPR